MTKINNPIIQVSRVQKINNPYKQHYTENKQSHHPSVERADTTLITNNIIMKYKQLHHTSAERADTTLLINTIITKINNLIIQVLIVQKINNPII